MEEDYLGKIFIPSLGWWAIDQALPHYCDETIMKRARELPRGRRLIALWSITYLAPGTRAASVATEQLVNLLGEDVFASFFQLTGFLMTASGVPGKDAVSRLLAMALGPEG